MNIVIRTDASVEIGTGHVMRCLTLADALRARGESCEFICRAHDGNLIELIGRRGYTVHKLQRLNKRGEVLNAENNEEAPSLAHAAWLGVDWQSDVDETRTHLERIDVDWLIVDHYGLDVRWETALRASFDRLMVVDDLADREHQCDLLLDQNWFGDESHCRYDGRVPDSCVRLIGPEYALIKPEYALLRELMPPRDGFVRRVLVFLGGSDPSNQTAKVLKVLMRPEFSGLAVDVVIGVNHPEPTELASFARSRPATTVHESLPSLAVAMTRADLMIGGGGSTTWERMSLGLPSIVLSIAANQTATNHALMAAGCIQFVGEMSAVTVDDIALAVGKAVENPSLLRAQSEAMQKMVKGNGAELVCDQLRREG